MIRGNRRKFETWGIYPHSSKLAYSPTDRVSLSSLKRWHICLLSLILQLQYVSPLLKGQSSPQVKFAFSKHALWQLKRRRSVEQPAHGRSESSFDEAIRHATPASSRAKRPSISPTSNQVNVMKTPGIEGYPPACQSSPSIDSFSSRSEVIVFPVV